MATTIFVLATNLPFFLYYDIGSTFLRTVMNTYVISQSYAYDWIPIYGVVALTIVEIIIAILKKREPKTIKQRISVTTESRILQLSTP